MEMMLENEARFAFGSLESHFPIGPSSLIKPLSYQG